MYLVMRWYSHIGRLGFWFPSCLYKQQIKRHVKLNDFNPLLRFETSSIRVSWRKLGLHRASPSLRDFPSSFASLQRRPLSGPPFCFPKNSFLLLDRKSTRLNSSHLVISYAVFCLKKKMNHTSVPCTIILTRIFTDLPTAVTPLIAPLDVRRVLVSDFRLDTFVMSFKQPYALTFFG